MKRFSLFAICAMLCMVLAFGISCTKKDKEAAAPEVEKAPAENQPMGYKEAPAPAAKPQGKGPLANHPILPFLKSAMEYEKYDSSEDSCRNFCKKWCPLAAKCQMPNMGKPNVCKERCYKPCTNNNMPKTLADCLMAANECDQVKSCFTEFRDVVGKSLKEAKEKAAQAKLEAAKKGEQADAEKTE